MQPQPYRRRRRRQRSRASSALSNPAVLLERSAAGIAISGDSGTGKSNLMLILIQMLIALGQGLTLVDPHGDLAADLERFCASLPDRLRSKVVVIRYSEGNSLASINPLGLDGFVGNSLLWGARIASKVAHVARILLYAWGERDFNSKPLLFKWVTRFLTMLARVGLGIPSVRNFFDPAREVYHLLAHTAGDFIGQLELMELADMRPRDREELIASTKNRFLGFLENPILDLVLGGYQQCLSMRRMIRDRMVVIIDLSKGGVLRDEDTEILANLFLNEILYAAFNTPRHERVPHWVFLDELPVFQSSFDLIKGALGQVRKFLVRFVTAFQGTQLFAGRTEDPLLNALIGQCGIAAIFRHKNPIDARFFGDLLYLPSADPKRVKHVLKQIQQYQGGHDLVHLFDESDSWSDAQQTGTSESQGTSSSTGTTSGSSSSNSDTVSRQEQRLADVVTRARGTQRSDTRGESSERSTSGSTTSNQSATTTHGGSRTRKQTLVPRIREREIITSIQYDALDEQKEMKASSVTQFATGMADVYVAGQGVSRVQFRLAVDPLGRTPRFEVKKVQQLRAVIARRPEFATPELLVERRDAFERRLIEHLRQLPMLNATPTTLILPPPKDDPSVTI